ncbi:hypothetical protein [Aquimarina longa]|uniref:hypothetical protein n=1 Tax=Aquimarina longa TaxID=1080221 RepID=UPI000780C205|nr:hypothetical protein [Aquimarina longa]
MSYTCNETLEELDGVLSEALNRAARYSNSSGSGSAAQLAHAFEREIDATRTQLSEALYKVDLAMHGYDDSVSRSAYEMAMGAIDDPNTLSDEELRNRYIEEHSNGYRIYDRDSQSWVLFSKRSEISITIERSMESDNEPAIHVSAYDPEYGKRLFYIDHEITKQDLMLLDNLRWGSLEEDWREMQYQSPFLGIVKSGSGMVGKSAGTLNAYFMTQHYNHSFLNMQGLPGIQWKSLDGGWHSYQEILEAKNGFVRQSLKTSHHWAKVRGDKAKPFSPKIGKICFGISVAISGYNIIDALDRNDSNKWGVVGKNALDITMGVIAFVPGFGWAISGTYFLMSMGGVFGDWGQPSGYTPNELDRKITEDWARAHKKYYSSEFDVLYSKPMDQMRLEMLQESREFARDNTYVTPRVIYKQNTF